MSVTLFKYLFVFPLLLTVSCVNIKYIGQEFPATKKVEFFYGTSELPKDKYFIMGKAILKAPESTSAKRIQNDILEKAESVGADAVVVKCFKDVVTGKNITENNVAYYNDPFWDPWELGMEYWGTPDVSETSFYPSQNITYNYSTVVKAVFLRLKEKGGEKACEKYSEQGKN